MTISVYNPRSAVWLGPALFDLADLRINDVSGNATMIEII